MEKTFSIYLILDQNKKPIYVGRTCNIKRRMQEHKDSIKNRKYYIYKKLYQLIEKHNYKFDYEVVLNNLDYDTSVLKEIETIANLKEQGYKLCNLTEGGEGLYGANRIFTEEHLQNLKKAKQKLINNGWKPANTGKTLEQLVGIERAKELKKISSKTHKGKIGPNKGKKLEEFVGIIRAAEIKKESSERAKKTFKRKKNEVWKQKIGEANKLKALNYTDTERAIRREINRNNAIKNLPRFNFKITFPDKQIIELNNFLYKELVEYILNNYNIKVGCSTIKRVIEGVTKVENTKHKIGFEII